MRFGVWGLGFGFGVWGLGVGVSGLWFGVWCLGYRVKELGCRGVREPGSLSRANGAWLLNDNFLRGWRSMKKRKRCKSPDLQSRLSGAGLPETHQILVFLGHAVVPRRARI